MLTVTPDRADGVNDPFRGEPVTFGDLCLAGRTTAEHATFLQQLRPGGAMDRAIHAAAAQQGRVGRIHDRVHALLRDVASDDFDSIKATAHHVTIWHPSSTRLEDRFASVHRWPLW